MGRAPSFLPSDLGEGLILASASPRRRQLLEQAGLRFEIEPADLDESARADEQPADLAERLAREKALTVAARRPGRATRWILGADTLVVLGREILGKPRDPRHAEELLGRLAGRDHRVLTGVAVVATPELTTRTCVVESRVRLRAVDAEEIRAYVATGEPLDKAGAYAVQGEGGRFVSRVEGSRSNVIGLPMRETLALLAEAGFGRAP